MEAQIQKQHLLAQAGVLANLKSSITPRRDRYVCGFKFAAALA
jgi:hypothetical protein